VYANSSSIFTLMKIVDGGTTYIFVAAVDQLK
jgi:hypothetical protein